MTSPKQTRRRREIMAVQVWGLSISKQLTELMGGTIGLSSIEGAGATFTINLPFEITQQDIEKTSRQRPDILKGKRFLIVDDSPDFCLVMRELARSLGLITYTACDGDEAMKIMRQAYADGSPIDLISIDFFYAR